jgi:DNA-binding MarR family transcriptional regulator
MVRRVRPDGDRRIVLAEILEPGREIVERGNERVAGEILPRIRLAPEQLGQLFELLGQIRRSIGDVE